MKVISFVVTNASGLMLGSDVDNCSPSVCSDCRFFSDNPERNCNHSEFAYAIRIGQKPIVTECELKETTDQVAKA